MAHMNSSRHILDEFAESLSDIAVIEKAPKVEGRTMTIVLQLKSNCIIRRKQTMPKMKTSRAQQSASK